MVILVGALIVLSVAHSTVGTLIDQSRLYLLGPIYKSAMTPVYKGVRAVVNQGFGVVRTIAAGAFDFLAYFLGIPVERNKMQSGVVIVSQMHKEPASLVRLSASGGGYDVGPVGYPPMRHDRLQPGRTPPSPPGRRPPVERLPIVMSRRLNLRPSASGSEAVPDVGPHQWKLPLNTSVVRLYIVDSGGNSKVITVPVRGGSNVGDQAHSEAHAHSTYLPAGFIYPHHPQIPICCSILPPNGSAPKQALLQHRQLHMPVQMAARPQLPIPLPPLNIAVPFQQMPPMEQMPPRMPQLAMPPPMAIPPISPLPTPADLPAPTPNRAPDIHPKMIIPVFTYPPRVKAFKGPNPSTENNQEDRLVIKSEDYEIEK